jgi:isopenicillin N synthase-like dioxygenase
MRDTFTEPTQHPSTTALPLIDVSPLRGGDAEAREAVGRQLRDACEQRGFFYITGHGVDPALVADVFAQSERLFELPDAEKRAFDKSRSRCNRGYEPLRNQTLQTGAPPDLKEGFYMGVDLPEDDPRVRAGRFNHGPNVWPDGLPGFRPTMERYFEAMLELGSLLMRGLALSLRLPEDHFDAILRGTMATLRLLHYPPQPPQPLPGERGCGEHTDFGSLTLLMQDGVGGLQVLDAAGGWIDAPPVPGTYVVNIGDLIARWTNRRYHSTLHRVLNSSGRERYSVPFFLSGAPDYVIECLPGCLSPGEAPVFPPVTVEQHVAECFRRTYG